MDQKSIAPAMAGGATGVNLAALDRLVTGYAQSEDLVESLPASHGRDDNCERQSRDTIMFVRQLIGSGNISEALTLIQGSSVQLSSDQKLLFRLYKQEFIELLRAGQRERALRIAKTMLEPSSLNAYPEAYAEFKKVMLALLYDCHDKASPVLEEWAEMRRHELAALAATAMRMALKVDDPPLSLTLRYLISLQDRLYKQHGWDPVSADLTSKLVLEPRDPAPVPTEHLHEAPAFHEAVVQCLAQAVGITRQEAVGSLRCTGGDLHQAFKNELGRMRVDKAVLDEWVHEYCMYRGLVDQDGPWPASWQLFQEVLGPKVNGAAVEGAEVAASVDGRTGDEPCDPQAEPMEVCQVEAGPADVCRGAIAAHELVQTVTSTPVSLMHGENGEQMQEDMEEQDGSVVTHVSYGETVQEGTETERVGGGYAQADSAPWQEGGSSERLASGGEGCEAQNDQSSGSERTNCCCCSEVKRGGEGLATGLPGASSHQQGQPRRVWKGRPPRVPPGCSGPSSSSAPMEGVGPPDGPERGPSPTEAPISAATEQVGVGEQRERIQGEYKRVLAVQELIKDGGAGEALVAIQELAPDFKDRHPQLYFELQQTEFLRLVDGGKCHHALGIARSELGPLAAAHPELLPHLKAALLTLARPGEPLIRPRSPEDLATAVQVSLATRLGLREPRLVRLLSLLLASHSCWFQEQLCTDEFAPLLSISALKEPSSGPRLAASLSQEGTASNNGGKDCGTANGTEPKSATRGFNEIAVLQLMEFMAVSRGEAIQLLTQYAGNVEVVLASLLGY